MLVMIRMRRPGVPRSSKIHAIRQIPSIYLATNRPALRLITWPGAWPIGLGRLYATCGSALQG